MRRDAETSTPDGPTRAHVGVGELVVGHPDAPVGDLDDDRAIRRPGGAHDHLRLRRRERGGVVEQLGQQVDEVGPGATGDGRRRRRLHDDPLVLLDLGHRGAQDVDDRHRRHVALGEVGAREDQQVFAVAPHAGGEVVELEQVGQLVGVLLVALQRLDELQLAFDEGLAAAGEVDEHGADVGLQRGLLGREAHGLPVDRVERAGHLADLVAGADRTGSTATSGASPARMLSTACGSRRSATVERRAAQQPQRPDQRARHQHRDRDADEQAEHEDDGVDAREVAGALGGRGGRGGQLGADQPRGAVGALRAWS
jgi:hypothetical protein